MDEKEDLNVHFEEVRHDSPLSSLFLQILTNPTTLRNYRSPKSTGRSLPLVSISHA